MLRSSPLKILLSLIFPDWVKVSPRQRVWDCILSTEVLEPDEWAGRRVSGLITEDEEIVNESPS